MRLKHGKVLSFQGKDYNLSLSDLMAGLLAIFIIVLCYTALHLQTLVDQYASSNIKRAELVNAVRDDLQAKNIVVNVDADKGEIHIPENLLFASGSADLGPDGMTVVRELTVSILGHVKDKEHYGQVGTIYIEGHTDNQPIHNAQFNSNWELSAQRAITTYQVMRYYYPNDMDTMSNERGERMFSSAGYTDTRPIGDNTTEEGRQANRRIDIRIVMLPPVEKS